MMQRLLIITQKVDKNDPVLGFFHRWLEEFAKHLERVEVICLWEGEHVFQSESRIANKGSRSNVFVHSLGKDRGYSKPRRLFKFWKYCWRLSRQVDGVFVHMNAVYVPLGWPIWKLFSMSFPRRRESRTLDPRVPPLPRFRRAGKSEDDKKKKIFLWRNHPEGGLLTRVACMLADRVYYTSPQAFVARYAPKAQQMPAGIDTEFFKPDLSVMQKPRSILCLGRISPIKRIEVIIEAAKILVMRGIAFTLDIVGAPANPEDAAYERMLRERAAALVQDGKVWFLPSVLHNETPRLYHAHELFVNATPSGSFDKTILEAMACRALPVVSNASVRELIGDALLFREGNGESLADVLQGLLALPEEKKEALRAAFSQAAKAHDIGALVKGLLEAFETRAA